MIPSFTTLILLSCLITLKKVTPLSPCSRSSCRTETSATFSLAGWNQPSNRRVYLSKTAVVISPILSTWIPFVSHAENESTNTSDDLAMPVLTESVSLSSPEDSARAAMQERIRRKMELQKKASTDLNFTESLAAEKEKQKKMKRSKEEMRAALCEELGRGC